MIRPHLLVLAALAIAATACDKAPEQQPPSPSRVATAEEPDRADAAQPRKLKAVIRRAALNDDQIARLRQAVPQVDIVVVGEEGSLAQDLREVADADALLTDWLKPELVRAGKRLRWIQYYAAGVDDILYPELVNSDIVLTNAKIIQGPEIADHGFALLLALTRRLNEIIPGRHKERLEMGYYRRPENWPLELQGRTALIIGMGGIGVQLAQRTHAFGMRVIGLDPKDIPYMYFFEAVYKPDLLHEVLPQADIVFMTAPLTEETRHMLGREEFARMKRGAYLIVLSRAGTYDPDALVEALREGRLAGAGLDVTDPVPLPPKHPLRGFENVIITPHMSGQSDKAWERRYALIEENLRRFAEGRPLVNVVDKQKGY